MIKVYSAQPFTLPQVPPEYPQYGMLFVETTKYGASVTLHVAQDGSVWARVCDNLSQLPK